MQIRSTTVVCVRKDGRTVMAGDGQVSIDDTIFKASAEKVRTMRDGEVVVGYAGAAADALALFERLEEKLDEYSGNLPRAALELVKVWRTDKALRHLQALLLVADAEHTYLISGTGDLLVPDDDVVAIGSGGSYATAAGKALLRHTDMDARTIAETAMGIAAEICVFTNDHVTVVEVE
ncbi:MAG: ATP-dependent protease subunit HslV [Armatimonadetes bacterium]|nr:ATP-dependent protease subunit HslV [Armatimonadota bacterium]